MTFFVKYEVPPKIVLRKIDNTNTTFVQQKLNVAAQNFTKKFNEALICNARTTLIKPFPTETEIMFAFCILINKPKVFEAIKVCHDKVFKYYLI